jgi:hypothetical protein
MIKALKAASILVLICAVGVVASVVVLAIGGDQQIKDFFNTPGAIEDFKKQAKTTSDSKDKVAPLVEHAKAFALRINPPPPPEPKRPKDAPKPRVAEKKPDQPRPKAVVKAKFHLLATCRYEQQPARSLALLDMPVKGLKWYRQGEDIGHLTLKEVKDGSVVCSDGQELFVPVSKVETKSLLKSDAAIISTSGSVRFPFDEIVEEEKGVAASVTELEPRPVETSPKKPDDDLSKRRRVRRLPSRKPRQAPAVEEPTPEQKKETITESIATIKEMMTQPDPSLEDAEREKELKIWEDLLKSLEEEQAEIEKIEETKEIETKD